MGVIGFVLIIVGVLALVLGLVNGVADLFDRFNDGAAQAGLPSEFLEVLKKMLEAGPAKFWAILGLILIVVGLALNGVEVFGNLGS